jgi:hypothetical protein
MSTTTVTATKASRKCYECKSKDFQYQCPRCHFRSCSLQCCQAHKERTGCNGKRDRTAFVPMSRMTDSSVESDYHFLEDVLQQVESGKRLLVHQAGGNKQSNQHNQSDRRHKRPRNDETEDGDDANINPQHPLIALSSQSASPYVSLSRLVISSPHNGQAAPSARWKQFEKLASQRGTRVWFMPDGMERRKSNQSHVRKQVIYWTAEWRRHVSATCDDGSQLSIAQPLQQTLPGQSVQPQSLRTLVCETAVLSDACQELFPSIDVDAHVLLMKRLPCPSNRPVYLTLNWKDSLATALQDRVVLEYPTIELVPKSMLSQFSLWIAPVSVEPSAATDPKFRSTICDQTTLQDTSNTYTPQQQQPH